MVESTDTGLVVDLNRLQGCCHFYGKRFWDKTFEMQTKYPAFHELKLNYQTKTPHNIHRTSLYINGTYETKPSLWDVVDFCPKKTAKNTQLSKKFIMSQILSDTQKIASPFFTLLKIFRVAGDSLSCSMRR
ncbi:hypothetical protein ES705_23169 [subsurface metagenome]